VLGNSGKASSEERDEEGVKCFRADLRKELSTERFGSLSQTSQQPQIQRLLPCREASRGQAEKGLKPRILHFIP
jgi:hypothetical protein